MSGTRHQNALDLQKQYNEAIAAWSSLPAHLKSWVSEPPCPLRSGSQSRKKLFYASVVRLAARLSSLSTEQVAELKSTTAAALNGQEYTANDQPTFRR